MRIVHLSVGDSGRAAQQLSRALREMGHECLNYVMEPGGKVFSRDCVSGTAGGARSVRCLPPCDVVHLHAPADAFHDRHVLRVLPAGVPAVWRLTQPLAQGVLSRGRRTFVSRLSRVHVVVATTAALEQVRSHTLLGECAASVIPDPPDDELTGRGARDPAREADPEEFRARRYEALYKCLLPGGRWGPPDAAAGD